MSDINNAHYFLDKAIVNNLDDESVENWEVFQKDYFETKAALRDLAGIWDSRLPYKDESGVVCITLQQAV